MMKKFFLWSLGLLLFSVVACHKSDLKKWEAACDSGNSSSCLSAAAAYHDNYEEAMSYYAKACNLNNATGCAELGLKYLLVVKSTSMALNKLQKSCALDPAKKGCWYLGYIYSHGSLVPLDYKIAVATWTKACNAGETQSCLGLAELWQNGNGVRQNFATAQKIYKYACSKGDTNGCIRSAELDAKTGSGNTNAILYQQELHDDSGDKATQNQKQGLEMFSRSCEDGVAAACLEAGSLLEASSSTKAYAFFNKGCDLGLIASCAKAGLLALYRGESNKSNQPLAMALLTKSCRSGEELSCLTLRHFTLKEDDTTLNYDEAARSVDQACRSNDYLACYLLANLLLRGTGVKANRDLAGKLLVYSCNHQVNAACIDLQKPQPIAATATASPPKAKAKAKPAQARQIKKRYSPPAAKKAAPKRKPKGDINNLF